MNPKEAFDNPGFVILPLVDLTSLSSTDNRTSILKLCQLARSCQEEHGLPYPAAICVYPPFAGLVKKEMEGTGVALACVAGAFPSGQLPLGLRLLEAKYCLDEGADEIDMVISRGSILEGEYDAIHDEVSAFKLVCGGKMLKVILETCELPGDELISKASTIALDAGADFIKTSTGKGSMGATPQHGRIMLEAIKNHWKSKGSLRGFKAAGGITDIGQALVFMELARDVIGSEYLNPSLFRIGASRLVNELIAAR